jgi:hypothetical protein
LFTAQTKRAAKPLSFRFPCEGRDDCRVLVYDFTQSRRRAELTVAKNFRAQTAATFQKFVCARRDGAIHPVAWAALLNPEKVDALDLELLSDEFVKIDATGHHVAPRKSRRAVLDLQCAAKFIENFQRKKCDLAFVIVFEIEVTIAPNASTGCTFDHWHLNRRVRVRLAAVVAYKIVSQRNV